MNILHDTKDGMTALTDREAMRYRAFLANAWDIMTEDERTRASVDLDALRMQLQPWTVYADSRVWDYGGAG